MYREYPWKWLLLFPFSLHIQSMPNFNSVFLAIFSTPNIHPHFPRLHIKQHPFKFSSIMTRSSKHNHNKKHSHQKSYRGQELSQAPTASYSTRFTKVTTTPNCARVTMPNCTQMDMFSPLTLYICNGEPPADFDTTLGENIYLNPNLDSMIYQLVLNGWIGGEQDKNNFVGTQTSDLYYLVDVSSSQPPVPLPALHYNTDLRVFGNLRDYVTSWREPLPTQRVVHLSQYTTPYHMVFISLSDHRIPSQNILISMVYHA